MKNLTFNKKSSATHNKICLFRNMSIPLPSKKLFCRKRHSIHFTPVTSEVFFSDFPSLETAPHMKSLYSQKYSISSTEPIASMHSSLPILTKMGCVLYWLRHEGIDIKCWKHTNREVFYTLEKRTLSRCQVVLMANYHRLKKGLPLFWVDNLTVG